MAEPTKVSDIQISRMYEVNCDECGVVDQRKRHGDALRARRLHFEQVHGAGRAAAS